MSQTEQAAWLKGGGGNGGGLPHSEEEEGGKGVSVRIPGAASFCFPAAAAHSAGLVITVRHGQCLTSLV